MCAYSKHFLSNIVLVIIYKKCSSFTKTYRVFRECRKRVSQHISATIMNGWNRDMCPRGMHLIFWRPCILSFQHFWTERFNFSWHLINICLFLSHFCSSVGFFFLLVLAALTQNLSVHNAGKNVLALVKRLQSVVGNILLVFCLFVWASCTWKKQYYTSSNSLLQMISKDHLLFLKKIFEFFSTLSVCSLYNSESGPKILRFLYNSNQII